MKSFLFILTLLLPGKTPYLPGIYKITSTPFDFSSIDLHKDGTFKYEMRGSSCWTWSDVMGYWGTNKDTLILKSYHPCLGEEVAVEEAIISENSDAVVANFRTSDGLPLSDIKVKYWGGDLPEQVGRTDARGTIKFKKKSIPKTRAFFLFEVNNAGSNHLAFAFTFLKYDLVNVCVNLSPRKDELWERQEKFIIDGDQLHGIETNSHDPSSTFKKTR